MTTGLEVGKGFPTDGFTFATCMVLIADVVRGSSADVRPAGLRGTPLPTLEGNACIFVDELMCANNHEIITIVKNDGHSSRQTGSRKLKDIMKFYPHFILH